jgi:hypothetical protein
MTARPHLDVGPEVGLPDRQVSAGTAKNCLGLHLDRQGLTISGRPAEIERLSNLLDCATISGCEAPAMGAVEEVGPCGRDWLN